MDHSQRPIISLYRILFLLIFLLLAFFSCQNNSVAPENQIIESDYTLTLLGSVNRDFQEPPTSYFTYEAILQGNETNQHLLLVFKTRQSGGNEDIKNQLFLRISINPDGFQLLPGDYIIDGQSISPTALQGNLSYKVQQDQYNQEGYVFTAKSLSLRIDSADETSLTGKMLVHLNQDSGFRMINGITEEVNLAFGGDVQAKLDFNLLLQR